MLPKYASKLAESKLWSVIQKVGMGNKRLIASLIVSFTNGFNHFLMVPPDFLKILIPASKNVQAYGFVGFPIGFENTSDEWILKPAIDQQV